MSNAFIFSQSAQHARSPAFICHWNPGVFNRHVRRSRASCFLNNGRHFHPGPLRDCSFSYKCVHQKSPNYAITLGSGQGEQSLTKFKVFTPYDMVVLLLDINPRKIPTRVHSGIHCHTIFNRKTKTHLAVENGLGLVYELYRIVKRT